MNIFKPTALYGKTLEPTDNENAYFLRVYTGGFAGLAAATERAREEAVKFLAGSEHSEFEILRSKRVWFPFSCVEFLIGFYDHPDHKEAEQAEAERPGH